METLTRGEYMNKTWPSFKKGKMSKYMRSEGSHGGAMKRMGREWRIYKKKHGMK